MAAPSIDDLVDQVANLVGPRDTTTTTTTSAQDATVPQRPPNPIAGMTVDDVFRDLNKSPLFMTELEENDDVEALRALNYEGTALENSANFKEQGNECFKIKLHVDAKEYYTKGILILAAEEKKRAAGEITTSPDGDVDTQEEIAEQKKLLETMYGNRAACHLALQNYRSCWVDCAAALRLNPSNVKACYRSAKALLAVDRIQEADDICATGLTIDSENKALREVADQIIRRAQLLDASKNREVEREAVKRRRAALVETALRARGIATRTTERPPEMEDAGIRMVPDPDDPRSALSFPAVLLYPAHLESDFIKEFGETQTLGEHLDYVFPLPWDREGVYTPEGVECYVETKEGGLLKMGRRVTLLKVLSGGRVEVVDEVVRIFVLPKGEAAGWVKDFKEKKAAMMRTWKP